MLSNDEIRRTFCRSVAIGWQWPSKRLTLAVHQAPSAFLVVEFIIGGKHPTGPNTNRDLTRYPVNMASRNCRKAAGSDTLKRAWVGPVPIFIVTKRGPLSSNMLSSVRSSPAQRATP
jgi:hypothetical protein